MPAPEVLGEKSPTSPAKAGRYAPKAVRIVYQGFFLLFFLAGLWAMTDEGIRRFPVRWIFLLDPLSAAGMLASSWILTVSLLWALVLVALTVLLGRAFCGWVCPLGTLNHLASWATRRIRRGPGVRANRFRPHFRIKYLLLIALLVAAAAGSLLSGLLDPISLVARSIGSAVSPALQAGLSLGGFRLRIYEGAWLTGAILVALLVVNRWIARWWCRALCPLGALLGWLSRAAIFRIDVNADVCTHCNRCAADCQGADEPFLRHRISECHVCLNCIDACPEGAIAFRALPTAAGPVPGADLRRRQILGAALAGAALVPLSRASAGSASAPGPHAIRPPGACPEPEFLARCVRCGACVNACPTTALQPSMGEAGIEAIYTPVLVPRRGWCEPSCTLCGHVCPTEAIRPLGPDEKGWTKPEAEAVRIGTAFFDLGRCLPWGANVPCIVCQEVCPTSPKAIWLEPVEAAGRDGARVGLQRPHMDPSRCVGCGLCEAKCPVPDLAAVRVTRAGESRSRGSSFTLRPAGRPS